MSLTRDFTDLLSAWPANDPALLDRCRLLLLDGLAVAVAGAAEPGPTLLATLARAEGGAPQARIIGKNLDATAIRAARINGMAMHVLDYEPMWNPPNHALSPLIPALLALAEMRERAGAPPQGDAVLRGIAKGVEAQGRLRLASGQIEPAKLTSHPPGAVGPIAAAIACADLLGLTGERLAAAAGIAASRCGALLANVGTMTKALHCGDAAANGLESALLAAEGFTADPDAIGSPRGWGASLFGPTFHPAPLIAPLQTPRALDPGPAWKLFPSQFATHFAITAALEAREQAGPNPIRRVTLRVPPMPYIDRPTPVGRPRRQVLLAIHRRHRPPRRPHRPRQPSPTPDASPPTPSQCSPAQPSSTTPNISGRFDQMHVEITLDLENAPPITQRCNAPIGSWSRPVNPARVQAKAQTLFEETLGAQAGQDILQATKGNFEVKTLMAHL